MIRVLFVHQPQSGRPGGAELSLASHKRNRPPDVHVSTVSPESEVDPGAWDAMVIANLRPAGGVGESGELRQALRWAGIAREFKGRVIRSERDVHPCCHRDARCLSFPELDRRARPDCSFRIPSAFEELYDACDAIQVLSPLHDRVIGALVTSPTARRTIGSPIDFDLFRCTVPVSERDDRALILADEHRAEDGADELAIRAGLRPERVPYRSVDYRDMPALLNGFRAVVVCPRMFHAFGRIVVEAMACGCRVLANQRVGALSWSDPIGASRRANTEFWNFVLEGARDT